MKTAVDDAVLVLKQIVQHQQVTNTILLHVSKQADAMICALEAMSRNTCEILNEAHIQTRLLRLIEVSDRGLLDIARTVNPGAALDLARREAEQKRMDECCPPPAIPSACVYSVSAAASRT